MRIHTSDYYSSDDHFGDSGEESDPFKLTEALSNVVTSMNREGYLQTNKLTVALITDCTTIHSTCRNTCYKALIDSGAAISFIWYSTYQSIDSSLKTPLQATTTKVEYGRWITDDGFGNDSTPPYNSHILNSLTPLLYVTGYQTQKYCLELIFRKKCPCRMPGIRRKNCYIQKDGRFLTVHQKL